MTNDSISQTTTANDLEAWSFRTKKKMPSSLLRLRFRARILFRLLGPFIDINKALVYGSSLTDEVELLELYLNQMGIRDVERAERDIATLRDLNRRLFEIIPELKDAIHDNEVDPETIENLSNLLDHFAKRARGDDLSSLRDRVLLYLSCLNLKPLPVGISPLECDASKADRGWNHPHTARMLCPADLLDDFDKDPLLFCHRVSEGDIEISGKDFPIFLWAGGVYDPEHIEAGLLRGELLIQAARCILTGPRSARKKTKGRAGGGGRQCISKHYNLSEIGPSTIAYIAVLTHFTLSSTAEWDSDSSDNTFEHSTFFDSIVGLFAEPAEDWGADTLEWWNEWLFGQSSAQSRRQQSHPTPSSTRLTTSDKLAQQRIARLSRINPT